MSPDSGQSPQSAGRIVIVVPRHDTKLYDYLKQSFADTRSVEVILDRRALATSGESAAVPEDLRRPRAAARSALGGILIGRGTPAEEPRPQTPPDRPAPAPSGPRQRLWPTLRPDDFTLEVPAPPRHD